MNASRRRIQASDSHKAAALVRAKCRIRPSLGLVLGSGFQGVVDRLEVEKAFRFDQLPGFPRPSVGGHAGKLLIGKLGGVPLVVLSGRAHFYEGYALDVITRPIRTLAALGVEALILTNAAGGIRAGLRPGEFMLLTDHINLLGNPLRGVVPDGMTRFVDMTRPYDAKLAALFRRSARRMKIRLHSGVYLAVSGPSYETPAEIRAFRRWGADAVGMSTVPEVIVARQHGMAVAAVSCITNLAAGQGNPLLSHADVLAAATKTGVAAAALIEQVARMYAGKN
jgi:purine-nucleoside phosphorylase